MNNALTKEWLVPIATNIIAAIVIYLRKPALALGKRLWTKGTITLNIRARLKTNPTRALLVYTIWLSLGFAPLIVNSYFIYKFGLAPGPPSRGEILGLLFLVCGNVYWLLNTIRKFKDYSVSDFA